MGDGDGAWIFFPKSLFFCWQGVAHHRILLLLFSASTRVLRRLVRSCGTTQIDSVVNAKRKSVLTAEILPSLVHWRTGFSSTSMTPTNKGSPPVSSRGFPLCLLLPHCVAALSPAWLRLVHLEITVDFHRGARRASHLCGVCILLPRKRPQCFPQCKCLVLCSHVRFQFAAAQNPLRRWSTPDTSVWRPQSLGSEGVSPNSNIHALVFWSRLGRSGSTNSTTENHLELTSQVATNHILGSGRSMFSNR